MKLIGTSISLAIDSKEIKKLVLKEDGTSRLIIKSKKIDDKKESIIAIDFNYDHTNDLITRRFNKEIIFIYGIYESIKAKNYKPFIDISVKKIIIKDKKEIIKTMNYEENSDEEFEINDLKYLRDRYKEICSHERKIAYKQ